MALALQGSLSSQSSSRTSAPPTPIPPPPAPASQRWGRTTSMSSRNPRTGLMECGICTEQMGGGAEKSMAAAPCGHAFCYDCLIAVGAHNGKCPTCRKEFTEAQIIKIYSP